MKQILSAFLLFFSTAVFFAQSADVRISYNGDRNYSLIERTDLRRYDNGKYIGLVSRETRSFIVRTAPPENGVQSDSYYDGSFYVLEGTRRGAHEVGSGINSSIPSAFRISRDGQLSMIVDNGYPSFRSFPAFPSGVVKPGDKWVSTAERAVDPLYKGKITKIPMTVEYTYLRDETFRGEDVYVLAAQWATRYGISYRDFGGDAELKSANGRHSATMYISKLTGNAIVVRDSVDETFVYADGTNIAFKGTISLFTEYPPAVDRSKIIPALQRVALISDDEAKSLAEIPKIGGMTAGGLPRKKIEQAAALSDKPITVENTDAGIRLTMQNLRFKADSAELLLGEEKRLNQIAAVLKEAPQSMFLVEGHTAQTGNATGEQRLSEERARTIARELAKRGISAEKFICKGSGARKPIASNATSEGKAKNRRVEITILE